MATETIEKIDVLDRIRFYIDGDWTVNDQIEFLTIIQNLYDYYSYFHLLTNSGSNNLKTLAIAYIQKKIFGESAHFYKIGDAYKIFRVEVVDTTKVYEDRLDKYIEPLKIIELKYASPGFQDIGGLGAIVGHVKEMLFKIIEIYENKNKRKLEEKKAEIENHILELKRNQEYVELLKKTGFSEEEIRKMLLHEIDNTGKLLEYVDKGQLKGIE